jgi:uroporphyrinogen III methyltransferase/synthase
MRASREAEATARVLRERGAEPIIAPTIEIGPPDDPTPARHVVRELEAYAWLVFASRAGVDAFFKNLRDSGGDVRSMAHLKIAAVGPKTAERLEHFGVRADLISGRYTSEDAAAELLNHTQPDDRVLLYVAQEGRDILRSVLAEQGRLPNAVAAYKTRSIADPDFASKVARADVLTFTSGSTVRGYVSLLGARAAKEAARERVVACIGPITAEEARDAGLRVDIVPDAFTTEALVDALDGYFARSE